MVDVRLKLDTLGYIVNSHVSHAIVGDGLMTVNKSPKADCWPSPAPVLLVPDCLVLNPRLPGFARSIF